MSGVIEEFDSRLGTAEKRDAVERLITVSRCQIVSWNYGQLHDINGRTLMNDAVNESSEQIVGDGTSYRTIRVVRDGAVDWLTLARPDRLNALNDCMVDELWDYFLRRQHDLQCRIVVLRGAGSAFCAGLDLKSRANPGERNRPVDGHDNRRASLSGLVMLMRACPQPIVALVHGPACGGGFVLALAADIRIAGESARMNVAFVKLGLSGCELGTSYFLPRMVGLSVARELMMTGRFIGAARALATGLVSDVVPDAELTEAADALLADLLRTSPDGLRKTKETIELTLHINDLQSVMKLEEHAQHLCMQGPDFTEAITAFSESVLRGSGASPDFGVKRTALVLPPCRGRTARGLVHTDDGHENTSARSGEPMSEALIIDAAL